MKIAVKSLDNEVIREVEVPESIFGYPYKEHLIHVAVEAYRAGIRRGTHSTKPRGEIRGSNRKPWRQKGTGRARAGSAKSPIWRGGGVVHGPRPRSYQKRLSANEKKSALKSVLSRKLRDEQIVVVETLALDNHKTQVLAGRLSGIGIDGKALLVDSRENVNLSLASRNNPRLKAVDALAVNVYDVIDRNHLVLSEKALTCLVEVLSR